MKKALFALLFTTVVFAAEKPVPSGPLKAFKGPEGEIIAMVEVNQSKEMLVYFKNIGGELDGKSKVYLFTDNGRQGKEVYFNHKWRKSKTRPWVVLSNEGGTWTFGNPTNPTQSFKLSFSQTDTDKLKIDEIIQVLQP